MKVSVVVPAYNEEKYIGKCLEGLMKQAVKPDEIIIVNNNSTDKTATIVKKYPVRLLTEKKQGITPARNRGFDEAKFDVIARTDADTVVPTDWVKRIKQTFKDPKTVAFTGPSSYYETPAHWSTPTLLSINKSYFRLMRELLGYDCLYGPNMAIRKSAWDKIKHTVCLNDKDVHEDIDLGIHIAPLGNIKFDSSIIVHSSFRRFRRFEPYLEYPYRVASSIRRHEQFTVKAQSTRIVKKIVAKALIKDVL
jgi:glycosyltransferase involved in cell wall biosynthesis